MIEAEFLGRKEKKVNALRSKTKGLGLRYRATLPRCVDALIYRLEEGVGGWQEG
jgi:hypothetical protein